MCASVLSLTYSIPAWLCLLACDSHRTSSLARPSSLACILPVQVSLVGLNALLALLHHSHFYQQVSAMLASFFPASVLQPVLVTSQVPLHSLDTSQSSLASTGEHRRWRWEQWGERSLGLFCLLNVIATCQVYIGYGSV